MKTQTFWKLAVIFVVLGADWARADQMRDVNVYSFVTPAGQKLTPPTADHPATYLLINGGYHEAGALVAGEKPPAPERVEALVKKALTAAHYLDVQTQKNPRQLDYIIAYYCGYMNPQIDESDDGTVSSSVNFNEALMIALVAGDSANQMVPDTMPWRETMQAAEENRYFVFIAAYSPAAYFKDAKREKKLLWRAQMSLASDGVTLDQSLDALVNSSVAYLGRQTAGPKQVTENLDLTAHVTTGTPVLMEFLPATGSAKPNNQPKP